MIHVREGYIHIHHYMAFAWHQIDAGSFNPALCIMFFMDIFWYLVEELELSLNGNELTLGSKCFRTQNDRIYFESKKML